MIWTCPSGHSNPSGTDLCGACGAPRLLDPARYRSLESVRAWRVIRDSLVVYLRRLASFITASFLMSLPHLLFQSWQWHTDKVVLPTGILKPLVALALLALWNAFWGVLMIRLAHDEVLGRWEGIGDAVGRLSAAMVFWAIVAQILVSVVSGLALLLLIVPGVIVAVKFSLTLPAVVCEGLGPVSAMKRSSRLVRGHGWSVFGAYSLLFLATIASFLTVGVFLWFAKGPWTAADNFYEVWVSGKNVLAQVLIGPFWAIVPTVFYTSLRSGVDEARHPETLGAVQLAAGEDRGT